MPAVALDPLAVQSLPVASADVREFRVWKQTAAAAWPFDQHTSGRMRDYITIGASDRATAHVVDTIT